MTEPRAHFYAPAGIELARRACLRAADRGGPQGLHAHAYGDACSAECSVIAEDGTERPLLAPVEPIGVEIPSFLPELWATEIAPDPPSRHPVPAG